MKPYYEDDLVTLYHGDCREVTEWLKADVLVTDPPYGISHLSGWGRTLWGKVADYSRPVSQDEDTLARDWALRAWGERPAIVFGSWRRARPNGVRALLIWDKGENAGMGDLSIPWKPNHEEIYVMGEGFTGPRTTGVLRAYVPGRISMGRVHPTEKPAGLMGELVRKCPSGIVADPFAGSGPTLIAAKTEGRAAIGVELDERYCEIAAKRLSQDTLFGGVA